MADHYDDYYKKANYFGEPLSDLMDFFSDKPRASLLDLGCGQGRNAVPLARMGFPVTGVDTSKEGINQMLSFAEKEQLPLVGEVKDLYEFTGIESFQYVLMDSMFHFYKPDKLKETGLIKNILNQMQSGASMVVSILGQGDRVPILKETIREAGYGHEITEIETTYRFVDTETKTTTEMPYRLVIAEVS
jgi:tellurite methyltransferase